MDKKDQYKYKIQLSLEEIKLPPFQDILVLAKNSVHGKKGLGRCFEYLVPNGFEMIEIEDDRAEAIFVNKNILAKIPATIIIEILKDKVFKFLGEGELLKVDFKVIIAIDNIEYEG